MTKTIPMLARKIGSNAFDLFAHGCRIGALRWSRENGGHWVFETPDEGFSGYAEDALRKILRSSTTGEALAALRGAYEAHCEALDEEARAIQWAEGAWLRAAETPTDREYAEDLIEQEREANDPWLCELRAGREEALDHPSDWG